MGVGVSKAVCRGSCRYLRSPHCGPAARAAACQGGYHLRGHAASQAAGTASARELAVSAAHVRQRRGGLLGLMLLLASSSSVGKPAFVLWLVLVRRGRPARSPNLMPTATPC
eukprot:scaffold13443_cov21-Tisochrysis_lutea.AAC.9